MSEIVDLVLESVNESNPSDVVIQDVVKDPEEEPVKDTPTEKSEPVIESEPVSTQEVVQNVQEILSSTETNVSGGDLEKRVRKLEERFDNLIKNLKNVKRIGQVSLCDTVYV